MNFWQSLLCSVSCLIATVVASALLTDRFMLWHRVPSNNPGVIFYYLYTAVPAAILGAIIGLAIPRFIQPFRLAQGLGAGLGVIAVLTVVLYFALQIGGHVPPRFGLSRVEIAFEVRGPQGFRISDRARAGYGNATLHAGDASTSTSIYTNHVRTEGERAVLPGAVYYFSQRTPLTLDLRLGERMLPALSVPALQNNGWTEWQPAADGFDIRYSLIPLGSREEAAKEKARDREKHFATMGPHTPILEYLPYLKHSDFNISNTTGKVLAERHAELLPYALDPAFQQTLLHVLTISYPLDPRFRPVLQTIGERIAEQLESYAANPEAADDPDLIGSNQLQGDFISWTSCWNKCQTKEQLAQSLPLLRRIQDAARKCDPKKQEELFEIAKLLPQYFPELPLSTRPTP